MLAQESIAPKWIMEDGKVSLVYRIRSKHLEGKIQMLPAVFSAAPLYFWVSRKADPALAPVLDQALGRRKAHGELARIYERWTRINQAMSPPSGGKRIAPT